MDKNMDSLSLLLLLFLSCSLILHRTVYSSEPSSDHDTGVNFIREGLTRPPAARDRDVCVHDHR